MTQDNKDKYTLEKIGPKLRILRKTFRFDRQSDLDEHLGFPKGSIHRIESGKGANSDNLITLLRFFYEKNININWIFDVQDKERLSLISLNSLVDNVGTNTNTNENDVNSEDINLAIEILKIFDLEDKEQLNFISSNYLVNHTNTNDVKPEEIKLAIEILKKLKTS